MNNKKIYGLIGYPLTHSFSKKYFTEKFIKEGLSNCKYTNFEIPSIDLLPKLVNQNPNLQGLSVTIPYKESIIPLLDKLDETAQNIAAVNAVNIVRKNDTTQMIGYNTDCYGFSASIKKMLTGKEKTALVFGSGGASKAVQYALQQLGIDFRVVSRKLQKAKKDTITYENITPELMSETNIFINTTPVGMYPKINEALDIPYKHIKPDSIAYDLTYNPEKTLFLKKAENAGAVICNGHEMLKLQADKAWFIFSK